MTKHTITKELSPNDTGETGGHQAGIYIPKNEKILSFFPELAEKEKNPRAHIKFIDDTGKGWAFAFIYYNNKNFGGTRDEYRLTRMTKYIKQNSLKPGDEIHLTHNLDEDLYSVSYSRKGDKKKDEENVIYVGKYWKAE